MREFLQKYACGAACRKSVHRIAEGHRKQAAMTGLLPPFWCKAHTPVAAAKNRYYASTYAIRSKIPAAPIPPPMHIVTRP